MRTKENKSRLDEVYQSYYGVRHDFILTNVKNTLCNKGGTRANNEQIKSLTKGLALRRQLAVQDSASHFGLLRIHGLWEGDFIG